MQGGIDMGNVDSNQEPPAQSVGSISAEELRDTRLRNLFQQEELNSDLNRHATAERLGISLEQLDQMTSNERGLELFRTYHGSGRTTQIDQILGEVNLWFAGERFGHDPREQPLKRLFEELRVTHDSAVHA